MWLALADTRVDDVVGRGSLVLKGLDVRDDMTLGCLGHSTPSGSLMPSTMLRFWSSLMPAE